MARDVKSFQSNMRELQQSFAALGAHKHFDEFYQIILHPGFTTKTDEFFVATIISAMRDQVQSVTRQLESLMTGARHIIEPTVTPEQGGPPLGPGRD